MLIKLIGDPIGLRFADLFFLSDSMHLYLGSDPRSLFLVTSSHEESQGRPRRALVFRTADRDPGNNPNSPQQAVVEFLPKDEVNLTNVVRVTSRIVKGCLGLISIDNGMRYS